MEVSALSPINELIYKRHQRGGFCIPKVAREGHLNFRLFSRQLNKVPRVFKQETAADVLITSFAIHLARYLQICHFEMKSITQVHCYMTPSFS